MTYAIEFTDVADMEVQDILFWMLGRSPSWAARWQQGFEEAVNSLREFPERNQEAPDTAHLSVTVRQHLYEKYRILYALVDADGDGILEVVRILHVRHGARRPLNQEE